MRAEAAAITVAGEHSPLVKSGAELAELSERFYRGLFVGALAFVGLSAVAALAFLPLRESVYVGTPVTIILTAVIAVATPYAVRHAGSVYRALRRRWELELILVVLAAALIDYPLRSELWWPSCSLLMLLAILVPWQRALAYCVVVLLTNLVAHMIAGDLGEISAVTILGLWVGYPFWALTFSLISERFAAHVARLAMPAPPVASEEPVRVAAWVAVDADRAARPVDERPRVTPDPPPPSPTGAMSVLTARQLQVTALLIDGLRYAEVGACLAISERQVQRHVSQAIVRAGVRTANELVAVALAEGLAPARPSAVSHDRSATHRS